MDPANRNTANEIFSDWRARVEDGENLVIENLCADHPEIAEALRHLHADWMLEGSRPPSTEPPVRLLSEQLRALFGEGIDPGICLEDPENTAPKVQPLDDLRSRGPDSTRYDVRDKVGQGGMGAVYRVFDHDLKRTLAMKVALDRDPARLARFLEEAQVSSQLDHPGIVPVHELGIDAAGDVFFTMKLVRGETLDAVFDKCHSNIDGWNLTRALGVLLRIAEAMAFAHEKRVIHRDLKPGNVMVGRHGEVYVMDWGLARVLDDPRVKPKSVIPSDDESFIATRRTDSTSTARDQFYATRDGDIVGTPAYMSPEQAFGKLDILGPQTDVYSLGAMLYRLLAGHSPYSDSLSPTAGFEIVRRILVGPPTPLEQLAPHTPPELHAICEKAMARELHVRYDSMAAFANDLRAYLENRVVAAYESGAVAELKKWMRRNRGLAIAASLALITTLGGLTAVGIVEKRRRTDVEQQKGVVETKRAELAIRKSEFDQLAGVVRLERAIVNAAALHPPWPEQLSALEHWLDSDAAALIALRPTLESTVNAIAARSESEGGDADRFLSETLSRLQVDLARFEESTIPDVKRRAEWARRIGSLTDAHPAAVASWDEARAAIAAADGVTASERYADPPIDLVPQIGMIPLGMNPRTLLWEFYDLRSACDLVKGDDPATRTPPPRRADGSYAIGLDSGIVFVLVPGGTFLQGGQASAPDSPNFDPHAEENESVNGTAVAVDLDPFFVASHELTQGQWQRLAGANPSFWMANAPSRVTLACPVENVSVAECTELLAQNGLELPTEAQWEYVARAGTSTPYSFGDDPTQMPRHGNVKDRAYASVFADSAADSVDEFDDGHALPGPVGSYEPNAFGLHDVHGNVMEWCRDRLAEYTVAARPGDGERIGGLALYAMIRGGCYGGKAVFGRCCDRGWLPRETRMHDLGCRPVRALRLAAR